MRRRTIFGTLVAFSGLLALPAIIRTPGLLMPIKPARVYPRLWITGQRLDGSFGTDGIEVYPGWAEMQALKSPLFTNIARVGWDPDLLKDKSPAAVSDFSTRIQGLVTGYARPPERPQLTGREQLDAMFPGRFVKGARPLIPPDDPPPSLPINGKPQLFGRLVLTYEPRPEWHHELIDYRDESRDFLSDEFWDTDDV